MPFLAPIIAGVAGFIGLAGTAATIFTTVATTALAVGASLLANKLLAPKAKTPPGGVEFDVRLGGDVFREIPFGRVATGGHLIYFNLFPSSTNKTLQLVYVLADWQCESLEAVWVDGEKKVISTIATANGADAMYQVGGYGSKFKIWWHAGASGQAANSRLFLQDNPSGRWDATDTLDGMCYVLVELEWDDELFPGGRPDLLFEIRGARLYDPRLDGTAGGVGTHRWADPTTWEWSENPAVGLYNFQRGFFRGAERILGMGIPAARLIADDYFAAMNVCDETLSEGGLSVARYTGALIVSEEHEHRVAIEGFLSAMAGRYAEQAGFHRIVPGAAQSSVATITQDDLVEGRPAVWSAHRGRDQIVNAVYGTFTNPDDGWQPVGYEPVIEPTWEAEDGNERIVSTLDLPAVTTPYQANRIAVLKANEHRLEARGSITVGIKFLAVAPLDWITFENDAGGERTYRVGRRRLNPDLTIELEIEEASTSAYGGAVVVTVPVVTRYADFAPITTVTNFAVTAVEVTGSDGQTRPGLRFTWDAPDDPTVDLVQIQYRVVGDLDRIRIVDPTPEDGVIVAVQGVMASTDYEARASIVTTPRRATTWTAWIPVTSSDSFSLANWSIERDKFNAPLDAMVRQLDAYAEASLARRLDWLHGQVESLSQRSADLAAVNDDQAQRHVTTLGLKTEDNRAEIIRVDEAVLTESEARASAITLVQAELTDMSTEISGTATAVTALDARVTVNEGDITVQAGEITSLDSRLTGAEGDIVGNAAAVTSLDTRVTSNEGDISATSSMLTSLLATTVHGTAEGNIRFIAQSAPTGVAVRFSIQARASSGDTFASAGLFLDALSTGGSRITMAADRFRIRNGDGTLTPFEVAADKIVMAADVIIDGNLLVTGSVQTGAVAPDAITEASTSSNAQAKTLTDSFDNMQQQVITLAADEKAILFTNGRYVSTSGSGGNMYGVTFKVLRDTTAITDEINVLFPVDAGPVAYIVSGSMGWFAEDDPGVAGTYNYALQAKRNGLGGDGASISNRTLIVLKAKR